MIWESDSIIGREKKEGAMASVKPSSLGHETVEIQGGHHIGHSRRSSSSFGRSHRRSASIGGSARWTNFGPDQTFARGSERREDEIDDEEALRWAALEKLPTYDRIRTTILENMKGSRAYREQVDLRLMGKGGDHSQKLMQNLFNASSTEEDNEKFLRKLRARMDKYVLAPKSFERESEHFIVRDIIH